MLELVRGRDAAEPETVLTQVVVRTGVALVAQTAKLVTPAAITASGVDHWW